MSSPVKPLLGLILGLPVLFASTSAAAEPGRLPGVELEFVVGEADGAWTLGDSLPQAFVDAGVQAGWVLTAVDGIKMEKLQSIRQSVAEGPARTVQLEFDTPDGETVLVVERAPMVRLSNIGVIPWPGEFLQGESGFSNAPTGHARIPDRGGVWWDFDPATGALVVADEQHDRSLSPGVSPVWWHLSDAHWALIGEDTVRTGDLEWAKTTVGTGLWLEAFQGQSFEHYLIPEQDGIGVYAVTHPRGTPRLPTCDESVPESCLVAGREIRDTLLDKPGGREAAALALGQACEGGVYRACLEAVALQSPRLEEPIGHCIDDDVAACHTVGKAQLDTDPEVQSDLTLGILEYSCAKDASGTLGDRLRRVEAVGEGCMMLAGAFDILRVTDRALLSLDQACMLGRAEACDEATHRRDEAFAMRTVRECEDDELPVAPSCTQLGLLLEEREIGATDFDSFGAYLRACELGDDAGCIALGDYVDRWGIDHPRVIDAENRLNKACEEGEQRACVGTAHLFVRHEPRTPVYGEALVLFHQACEEGLPNACVAGAEQRRKGSAKDVEVPESVLMWSSACDLGDPFGCNGYGERLSRDKDTWTDAYSAWTRACDIGSAESCTDLGRFVEKKHEPAYPDEQESAVYLRRGCDNGDAEGCYWLAEPDIVRKEDPPEPAYMLLEQSCEGAFGLGCATLARVHLDRKTSFDDELAAGHLEAACDNGHFDSCRTLGTMYAKGQGVEKDRLRAREFAQRYSVNARRRHARVGVHMGFPYVLGGEAELVAPIPVGPAIAVTGSYSYLPGLGRPVQMLEGDTDIEVNPDLTYWDAGVRLYPNNKARGLYGMVGWHQFTASGGELTAPVTRYGPSLRLGIHNENKMLYTKVEMGLGQYGIVDANKFDEDESATAPLILSVLGFSVGMGF